MKLSANRWIADLPKYWEQHPTLAWTLVILWVVFLGGFAFLWNLGSFGLIDETEPLFAEAARQMTVTGDWVTPYFNEVTRFDKPPLIYWLMAIAYQTVGVNEWAARLPSALSAIALTGLSVYTLWKFGFPTPAAASQPPNAIATDPAEDPLEPSTHLSSRNRQAQVWWSTFLGAAIIALTPEIIAWGRIGVSDMLLTACLCASLLAFFMGYAQPTQPAVQQRWYTACYVLIALAILAKGPIGIVLPGLIIGAFLLYLGQLRTVLREMRLLRGGLIILLIAVPWYILVTLANGEDYIRSFFGYHNLERFTGVVNAHDGPWYSYFPIVLLGFFPWSIYLPVAIARLRFWKLANWRDQPRTAHLGLFALIWFACIFGFFTIAVTKRPSYVLPLMPAAGILVALLWSEWMTRQRSLNSISGAPKWLNRSLQISAIANILLIGVLAGVLLYSPRWLGDDPTMPNLAQMIRASGLTQWGAGIWTAAAVIGLLLMVWRQTRWLWLVNLLGFMVFFAAVAMPASFILDAQRQQPLRELAAITTQVRQPGEELIMLGFWKPSLVFYTQQPVTFIPQTEAAITHVQETADARPDSVLLLMQPQWFTEIGLQPDQYQELAQAGAYQLVRVNKQALTDRAGA